MNIIYSIPMVDEDQLAIVRIAVKVIYSSFIFIFNIDNNFPVPFYDSPALVNGT